MSWMTERGIDDHLHQYCIVRLSCLLSINLAPDHGLVRDAAKIINDMKDLFLTLL